MLPPQQGLNASHSSREDINLGLVQEKQLVALHCLAQIGLQCEATTERGTKVWRIELVGVATGVLCAVERSFSVFRQYFCVAPVCWIQGNADAWGHEQFMAIHHERFRKTVENLPDHPLD